MFFQSSLAAISDYWFPGSFQDNKLIKCGLDHEIYGISVLRDYIFQFEKCAVIIYPPPLNKHLDENVTKLNLENGYRFTFEEIQTEWKPNFCEPAKSAINTPVIGLFHLNYPKNEHHNHILAYFIGLLQLNQSIEYYAHDFDMNNDLRSEEKFIRNDIHFILMTDGNEQYLIHNRKGSDNYAMTEDPLIGMGDSQLGPICIEEYKENKDPAEIYRLKRGGFYPCEEPIRQFTDSFLRTISFTFTAYDQVFMISMEKKYVLIFKAKFFQSAYRHSNMFIEKRSLDDFFICKSRIKDNEKQQQPTTTKENVTKIPVTKIDELIDKISKFQIPIIIVIVIVIIVFFILIIYRTKHKNKKIMKTNNLPNLKKSDASSSKSTLQSKNSLLTTTTKTTMNNYNTMKKNFYQTMKSNF